MVELKRGKELLGESIPSTSCSGPGTEDELDRIETLEEETIAEEAEDAEEGARAHDDIIEEDSEEVEDEFPVPPSPGSVRAYPYPYAIRVPQVCYVMFLFCAGRYGTEGDAIP